ncbi:HlyD family type I secretion periplasmic adaptor subunit [Ottowia sp. VDI28]|uniref:HlyD family type I secretion periplasmic adaptor subunit n=1 Tax=Ottowia sp. VDI28 TaxID=3133968 RepID=UPI003C2D0B55
MWRKRDDRRAPVAQADLALLSDLNAALQNERHYGMALTVGLLTLLVAAFVAWAYFSNVEEVTRGQGSVIPSSREQVIQSLDPGVLSELLVREGDLVEADQVLVRLDTARSSAVFRESRNKVDALRATAVRLRAESYGTPLKFDADAPAELIARETAAYRTRTRAVNESVQGLLQSKRLLDNEIAITEPMAAKGVVSEVEILRMKRQSNELQLQITERRNKFQSDANTELVRVEAELAQSEETMVARADPVKRSEIKAPLRGVVKNIRINTVGGVIGAGQGIMEIVPVEGPLLVEGYIRPQDVAFIKPSDQALVKLTAYDYSLYGGLNGVVKLISPDTLQDNRRPSELKLNPEESYYRVIVETHDNHLTDRTGKALPIIPGMIATVDIKTGEKTVFQYLTKPITRLKQALRER